MYNKLEVKITNGEKECIIKYRVGIEKCDEFWFRDIQGMYNNIELVILDSIYVPEQFRNQGYGSECLSMLIDTCIQNERILIVRTSALTDEYPEEPTAEQFTEILNKLDKFFTERGFTNINQYTKSYQFSELYVYTGIENSISDSSIQGHNFVNNIKEYYNKE